MTCPKCGRPGMDGPRYTIRRSLTAYPVESESLVYRCGQCGYEKLTPCADAQEKSR